MEKVLQAYAGHVDNQPHKYLEGEHTLAVKPESIENARLIIEVDAQNTVINWHIGGTQQIYYVEGCS